MPKDMNETRKRIVDMLAEVAGASAAARVEQRIYTVLFPQDEEDEEGRERYQHILYNMHCLMHLNATDRASVDRVVSATLAAQTHRDLEKALYVLSPELAENQRLRDDYLTNPMDVSEGVEPCPKCKCTKSYSYQKQLRSGDEGFSTICTCANPKCRYRWRIN